LLIEDVLSFVLTEYGSGKAGLAVWSLMVFLL